MIHSPTPLLPLPGSGGHFLLKLENCLPSGSWGDRAIFPLMNGARPGQILLLADWGPLARSALWAAAQEERRLLLFLPEKLPAPYVSLTRLPQAQTYPSLAEAQAAARRLAQEAPERYFLLEPELDPEHPMAYCETLAPELWQQTGGTIGALVGVCHSGGALFGCSLGLKRLDPRIQTVAAVLEGGCLGSRDPRSGELEFYAEPLCDQVAFCDREAARRQEAALHSLGLPCGLLGGCGLAAARSLEKLPGPVVVLIPDREERL